MTERIPAEAAAALPVSVPALRRVLGRFATGVTVITTWHDGRPYGMTANAFSSVSLDPPLVLVSVDKRAATCHRIVESGGFAVNVLSDRQESLALRFAGRHRDMADPFGDLSYRRGDSGSPLLADVVAWIDCTYYADCDGGDHTLFLGRVGGMGLEPARPPLIFYAGAFQWLGHDPAEGAIWAWG